MKSVPACPSPQRLFELFVVGAWHKVVHRALTEVWAVSCSIAMPAGQMADF